MTHSLYRTGGNIWGDDWVVVARAARGINDAGAAILLRRFLEYARSSGAVNWGHGRGGCRLNTAWEAILNKLVDLATVTVVFDDSDRLEKFLEKINEMNLGLSITVSGDVDRIQKICAQYRWKPDSCRQVLGIFGAVGRLPSQDVLCITSQCGHSLIAAKRVQEMVTRIRIGRCTAEDAAVELGKACVCGLLNPSRTALLLRYMADHDE